MRIAIFTPGRFHVLDLARELIELGHQVKFYSLVPAHRTARFGLPRSANRWLGWYAAPAYGLSRALRGVAGRLRDGSDHLLNANVDVAAAATLEPCDVLVAMSGVGLRVIDAAKRRYGALVFLERSSRHIRSQREILAAVPHTGGRTVPDWSLRRELAGYARCDVVSVPAEHVRDSFLERGFPADRLFVNPFGVDVSSFNPVPVPDGPPTVIMVGLWSFQKGCDVLARACTQLEGVRLMHVGPVGDAPLPDAPWFTHHDAVPQAELPSFYAKAHVAALASRQEGLAVVQVQALASGVPLVCTTRTGGADLQQFCVEPGATTVVPPDDPDALACALRRAVGHCSAAGAPRSLLRDRQAVSWAAYAKRYEGEMLRRLATRDHRTRG